MLIDRRLVPAETNLFSKDSIMQMVDHACLYFDCLKDGCKNERRIQQETDPPEQHQERPSMQQKPSTRQRHLETCQKCFYFGIRDFVDLQAIIK